ncbi:MAG: SDR family oxidoreductase [Prevotellaceae bacterium]|jgi:NAD(P)-dependent dehydrogenase (short-subunit alcohol dehydrogenase family)|nr:SDR family oxidoreductase [Prevotellaceae bacterium]
MPSSLHKQAKNSRTSAPPPVVLITGASSGIGKACAEYLVARGFVVYGASRNPAGDAGVYPLPTDVTQPESAARAAAAVIAAQGRIDVLINNAGMGIGGAIELATPDEIRRQMQTNFMGTVNMCAAVLPYMRPARRGRIINISSLAGSMAIPYQGFYSASKFAIEGYSEALSMELQPFGIKVSVVEPGDFSTGFTAHRIVSEATLNHPDYGLRFNRCLRIIEKEERHGCSPAKLARKLYRIIRSRHPKFRYRIGALLQVVFTKARAITPARWHQTLLRLFYGLLC